MYTKPKFCDVRHNLSDKTICWTTKIEELQFLSSNKTFVGWQIVSSDRLCRQTDCVVRQIVSSDRLCCPTDCVVRQIVSSNRLCRPTDCVVRPYFDVSRNPERLPTTSLNLKAKTRNFFVRSKGPFFSFMTEKEEAQDSNEYLMQRAPNCGGGFRFITLLQKEVCMYT
jgi:hypothetical protein